MQQAARRLTWLLHILVENAGRVVAGFYPARIALEVADRMP
jgi:hypothetical protein